MHRLPIAASAAALSIAAFVAPAQQTPPSTVSYQGRLDSGSGPVDGTFDLRFRLYASATGGEPIAEDAGSGINVEDGLFSVDLNFGAGAFAGEARFLEIDVAPSGTGAYTTLSPRQAITAAPRALSAPGFHIDADGSLLLGDQGVRDTLLTQEHADGNISGSSAWQSFTVTEQWRRPDIRFETNSPTTTLAAGRLYAGTGVSGEPIANLSGYGWGPGYVSAYFTTDLEPGTYTVFMELTGPVSWKLGSGRYDGGRASAGSDLDHVFSISAEVDRPVSTWNESGAVIHGPLVVNQRIGELSGDRGLTVYGRNGSEMWLMPQAGEGPASIRMRDTVFGNTGTGMLRYADRHMTLGVLNVGGAWELLTLDAERRFAGLNTTSPLGALHIIGDGTLGVTGGMLQGDQMILEDSDAILGLYSNAAGSAGSAIVLGEISGGELTSKWSLVRQTGGAGDALRFTFGTGVNQYNNPTIMHLDDSGNVGIGDVAPQARLSLGSRRETLDGTPLLNFTEDGTLEFWLESGFHGTGPTGNYLRLQTAWATDALSIRGNGYVGLGVPSPAYRLELPNVAGTEGRGRANAWVTYSSARFKENVRPIGDALDLLERLRGVRYDWLPEHGGSGDLGLIAEEVAEVLPELVVRDAEGAPTGLDYGRLVPVAIEAIKAQQAELDALRVQVEELARRLDAAVEHGTD